MARGLKDDLPDGTSEDTCGRLARRANHFVIPEAALASIRNPFVKSTGGEMDSGPAPDGASRNDGDMWCSLARRANH